MPDCTADEIDFGRLGRRQITANFDGGAISSEGGLMLLRDADRKIGLSLAVAKALSDTRCRSRIKHGLHAMVRQRLYAQCQGWEDLNDHNTLRHDLMMQTAVGTIEPLASAPTLCRLEKRATREQAWALHGVLVDQFVAGFKTAPKELVLDFDASNIPLHGNQEGKQFHGYYDHYCYLPLYVFCGQSMLACYLRNSRIDGAKHAAAVLKLLVVRLFRSWPQVRIIVRADSGFCRQRLVRWCERHGVEYVIGVAKNGRLRKCVATWEDELRAQWQATREKQRSIHEFRYAAKSWKLERRVITRLEYGLQGTNPRFVVTNLDRPADELYDKLYCHRGEAENRIKECQLDTSPSTNYASFLHLDGAPPRAGLGGHRTGTRLRSRLLKIGATIVRNTRRIRLMLSSQHPLRHIFHTVIRALAPPESSPECRPSMLIKLG